MFCFCAFPEYLQIFPEGTLQCDVAPPVFKAQLLPGAPQQIVFSVSPAGKETLSLQGFGCHIMLKDARANSTFPSVPTGKVRIKKASDCEIIGEAGNSKQDFVFQKSISTHVAQFCFFEIKWITRLWLLIMQSQVFSNWDYILHFPPFPSIKKKCFTTP